MSETGKAETGVGDEAGTPQEPNDDDLKALLAKRQHAKPNKATWVLLVLLILAIGFTLGSCMQRAANGIGGGSAEPRLPGGAPSAAPDAGTAGRPGDLTIGTVESVDGTTMTITTPDGRAVLVEVPEGTSVTTSVEVPLADLPVGTDVVIRGTEEADGTVTAESVAEASGVLPGGGLRSAP